MEKSRFVFPLLLLSLLFSQVACESSDDASGNYWQSGEAAAPATPDAVPFGSLNFCFGGVNGSGAQISSAQIRGLRVSGDTLSYSWGAANLSAWGLSESDASALACLFVKKSDGAWVGGKFDWISTSRTSRILENVFSGYCGWSLHGVPNPCEAAFVIISSDGRKRTNVISTTWRR